MSGDLLVGRCPRHGTQYGEPLPRLALQDEAFLRRRCERLAAKVRSHCPELCEALPTFEVRDLWTTVPWAADGDPTPVCRECGGFYPPGQDWTVYDRRTKQAARGYCIPCGRAATKIAAEIAEELTP